APDPLAGGGERVQAVDLGVLVGGLVAVDDDLVAGLPAGDALADLPHDPRGVGAADVVAPLGVIAVAPDAHGLAQRRPHVVEVHAGGHHAHDHLERAGLGYLDLLQLERVDRLALALLADDPG